MGVIRDMQQLNSRFGIDGWDMPHYVMRLFLLRDLCARVPQSHSSKIVSEPVDGGLYEAQK
jgi:hypothetical protein